MTLDERTVAVPEESFVPIFLEKYVLPTLAACLVGVILLNPFKLPWQQQGLLAVLVTAVAYGIGRALHKRNAQRKPGTAVKQQSFGANSPNIIGNQNTVGLDKRREE
jgi:hypothetical protein